MLILAVLLCCHGWAAAMQDVMCAQAGLADEVVQADTRTGACSSHASPAGRMQPGGSTGALNLDDTAIFGLPELTPVEVVLPPCAPTRIAGTLPFRWLERPMRPPCPAALRT